MSREFRQDRREFIKNIGRKLAAGVLLIGTGVLVCRKPGNRNETCTSDGVCTRCSELSGCGLPQALSSKRALRK